MSRGKQTRAEAVEKTTGAIAGLFAAIAIIVKFAAYMLAPTGLVALAIAVGLKSPPVLATAAVLLGAAAALWGAIYGLARFWAWIIGRPR